MACSTNVTYLSYELNEDNFPRIIRSAISQPISVERFEMLLKSSSLGSVQAGTVRSVSGKKQSADFHV